MNWRSVADNAKGWLSPAEGDALHRYALGCEGPFVEIGGYCGKSACWIGDAARERQTVLFSVDHHRGSPEMAPDRECHDPDVMIDGTHDTLPMFRRTIRSAGLEPSVIPVVGDSPTVGIYWSTPIGFLFIDGAHDGPGCLSDYLAWGRHVTGILAFHDATIPEIGVVADRACTEGFELIEEVECMRVLRRC